MIGLLQIELGIALVAALLFVVLYVWRSRWRESPIGRHMAIFAVALAGTFASLLALSFGLPVPLWVFAVGFGLLDVLLVQRIVLLIKAQEGPP